MLRGDRANEVDAPMEREEASIGEAAFDLRPGQAHFQKLIAVDHAMLASGQGSNQGIGRSWGGLCSHRQYERISLV